MFKFSFAIVLLLSSMAVFAQKQQPKKTQREFMEIKVYHAADNRQLGLIQDYLKNYYFPALEEKGFDRVGAFRAIANDTAADKRIYVFIPLKNMLWFEKLNNITNQLIRTKATTSDFLSAAYNQPPFTRYETILLHDFVGMPQAKAPSLKGELNDRVYELRSYESATDTMHINKVRMFNSGEVDLFERLGFNTVFYGQVIAGCRMPNLMYMTSFDNKASRDEHWKAFGSDPVWKSMSSDPQYQNNVSRNDIVFLAPLEFSKL